MSLVEFNNKLSRELGIMDFKTYLIKYNEITCKLDLDILTDEFVKYLTTSSFDIHQNELLTYNIIKSGKNIFNTVQQLFIQYNLICGRDYIIKENIKQSNKIDSPIIINTDQYTIYCNSFTFKMCLMRTLRTQTYVKLFILLEEAYKSYIDYLLLKHDSSEHQNNNVKLLLIKNKLTEVCKMF